MKRILAAFCYTAIAIVAHAGPQAGRTLVLDVAKPDNAWSTTVTRGESIYVRVDTYNRGSVYTNNDLTGYIWYASNSTAQAGVRIASTTNERGSVWFLLSATDTLGLSTNDTFPTSYFAQVVLTNATVKYDWSQGRVTCRHGAGISATGSAAITTLNNGGSLTNLNASELRSGTVPLARLHSDVTTNNASTISSGTLALARLPSDATTNNASTLSSGTVPLARLHSDVTTNNASTLSSGTVPIARLSGITSNQMADTERTLIAQAVSQSVTNGLDTVTSVDGKTNTLRQWTETRVNLATQTIAGASVSGSVPNADAAVFAIDANNAASADSAEALQVNATGEDLLLTSFLTVNGALNAYGGGNVVTNGGVVLNGTPLVNGTTLNIGVQMDSAATSSVRAIISEIAATGTYYKATVSDYATSAGTSATATNADYATVAANATNLNGLASDRYVTNTTSAKISWRGANVAQIGAFNDDDGERIAFSIAGAPTISMADYPSAVGWYMVGVGATPLLSLTNDTGAFRYLFGNGGNVVTTGVKIAAATNADWSAVAAISTTLVDNATITIAEPTESNSPASKSYVDAMQNGDFVSFFRTNLVTTGTNGITGTVLESLKTIQTTTTSTGFVANAVGQYLCTFLATNRTVTQLQGGVAEIELWLNENTAGSLTLKPELYLYDTVNSNLVEFGETVASQTVAAGSASVKHLFTVPYPPFATNNACQLAVRLKVTSLSATPTVLVSCGGATPSHFSIDVPVSSLVPDNAVNSYNLNNVPANRFPTNLVAGTVAGGLSDPCHEVYVISTYSFGTVWVSRVNGEYQYLEPTNNVTICVDQPTFPALTVPIFHLSIATNPAYSVSFCTTTISTNGSSGLPRGSGSVSLTNRISAVIFEREYGSTTTLWGATQIR